MKSVLLYVPMATVVMSALVGLTSTTTWFKPTTPAWSTTAGASGLNLNGKMFTLSVNGGGVSFYSPYFSPTTRRPYYTTRRPYYTTRRPYYTTRRPYTPWPTTRDPYHTTRDPYHTTRDPYYTTRDPYHTTRDPYYTTRDPYYTTHRPYYTTHRPYTTRRPYNTTTRPYTTRRPYYTTTRPYTTRRPYYTTTRPYTPWPTTRDPYYTTTRPYTPQPTTRDPYYTTTRPTTPRPWTTAPPTRGVSVCLRYMADYLADIRSIFTLSPSSSRPLQMGVSASGLYRLSFDRYGYNSLYLKPYKNFWANIGLEMWTRVCLTVDTMKNVAQLFSDSRMSIRKMLPNNQYVWSGEPVIDFSDFDGQVTDVQIWDYSLHYREVLKYMTSGRYGPYPGSALSWSYISYSPRGTVLLEDVYERQWQERQLIKSSKKKNGRRAKGEKKSREFFNLSESKRELL